MTLWSQGCRELVKLLHGCDEVVTRLSEACDKVAGTLQPCHNLVISEWEGWYYSNVTLNTQTFWKAVGFSS